MKYGTNVVTHVPLPSHVPAKVEQARKRFEAIAEQHAAAQSIVHRARTLLAEARKQDVIDNADAYAAGKEPKNLRANEERVEAEVGEAQAKLAALSKALDDVGNDLAAAITEAQPAWRDEAEQTAVDALAAYHSALDQLKAAVKTYAEAKSVADWLTVKPGTDINGNPNPKVKVGWSGAMYLDGPTVDQRYPGVQPVRVRVGPLMRLDDPCDVTSVFPVLELVGKPVVKQTVKKVNHPAESKFAIGDKRVVTSKEPIR